VTARVLPVSPDAPDPTVLRQAAAILRAGGLVAFPTETVYGLGANALDADAVRRIFEAKGRPSFNPVIAHVADAEGARALVRAWPPLAEALAARFWPGPLTLVLPRRPEVPDVVTAGRDGVAVRVPAHPVARALIAEAGIPLAAPSANRFTHLSPVTAAHVVRALGDRVDLILDGGRTDVGIESTVVDLTTDPPTLLRPGTIPRQALEAVTGPLAAPAAPDHEDAPRAAPGMIARHYAPRAQVRLVDAAAFGAALREAIAAGGRVGALTWSTAPRREVAVSGAAFHRELPADALGYAAALYEALHAADDAGCASVVIEMVPARAAWDGVRDRLTRAAHQG